MIDELTIKIPPIASAGLMLTYRCNSACKHCVYRCSPQMPDEWITLERAKRVFEALQDEPRFTGLHFAGGEATINMDLLVKVVEMAVSMRIPLDYLETNARVFSDLDQAKVAFKRLRDAGLPCVMISASMYHNEFVPFANTQVAVAAAEAVFGSSGYFVYPMHLYQLLSKTGGDGRRRLDAFCERLGIEPDSPDLLRLFPLIPSGRVPEALGHLYPLLQPEDFEGDDCADKLMSPHHAHIDLYGNLFTGSCCGISPGTVDNFHPEFNEEDYPVFAKLCQTGPLSLLSEAEASGFEHARGYISKCDLCYRIRAHLHKMKSSKYEELRPACFYDD